VEVEFDQIQSDHVIGRVFYNQMDVGLQVIRDGVAWYDKTSAHSLTEVERGIYSGSEEAARNEMRGIWKDGSPMPPWEWRRAEAAKSKPPATLTIKRNGGRGLQSEDILVSGRAANGPASGAAYGRDGRTTARLAKPSAKPLNRPGENVDFSSYLKQGRISIVYFYADWCPACRQMTPLMDGINAHVPDMQVLFMNIGDWNTPVTQRYGITSIPHLKIYDNSGSLVAEGRDARTWLQQNMNR